MELKDVKANFNRIVVYDGGEYILSECILWQDENNEFKYSVLLEDRKRRQYRVPMEKVEVRP